MGPAERPRTPRPTLCRSSDDWPLQTAPSRGSSIAGSRNGAQPIATTAFSAIAALHSAKAAWTEQRLHRTKGQKNSPMDCTLLLLK
jgi:hypothetical protein